MSRDYAGYSLLEKPGMSEYPDSSRASDGGNPALADDSDGAQVLERDLDIVQFVAPVLFATEEVGVAEIIAIRVGALTKKCTVDFKTKDVSAIAGCNYFAASGQITFNPNEEMKRIEITLRDDHHYDANLEFEVILENPMGCVLALELQRCRLVIVSDDVFPNNKFREDIAQHNLDKHGLSLLGSFIMFCILRIPLVGWRVYVNILLDQLHNVYYLASIKLNIYLVDVVFKKVPETEDSLWIHGNRLGTAVLVAAAITVPKAILCFIEYSQIGQLAVAGKARLHLKVNLFRKYLFYSAMSHSKVSAQSFTKAIDEDVNEIVKEGFMAIFKIVQKLVKACLVLYFLVKEEPWIAVPLFFYPFAMVVVLNMRYSTTLELDEKIRDKDTNMLTCLKHSMDDLGIIKEYSMRPKVCVDFAQRVQQASAAAAALNKYDFKTMLVMPWVTTFAVAGFIIFGGYFVLSGTMSLGFFLATLAIYKDAGELFASFYEHMKNCYTVIGPLLRVVSLLNLPSEFDVRLHEQEVRLKSMELQFKQNDDHMKPPAPGVSRFDLLHIRLAQASLATDRGGPQHPNLQNITASVAQGKLVAILGPHAAGKYSLLRLLKGTVMPRKGQVQVPTHLRCICVPRVPQLFESGNLIQNLTFGTGGDYKRDRLLAICERVGLDAHTMDMIQKALEEDTALVAKSARQQHDTPWYEAMSQSELLKVHIVRALHYDPDILLLQRPVDEMEADHARALLEVLREFVDSRGILVDRLYKYEARPHTVFFTSGEDRERAETASDVADVVWHLSKKGFQSNEGGTPIRVWWCRTDNKMVNSWSREAQYMADELLQERRKHAATKRILEDVKTEVASWEKETDEAWLPDTSNTRAHLDGLKERLERNGQGGEQESDPLKEVDILQKKLQEALIEVEELRNQNKYLEKQLEVSKKDAATSKASQSKKASLVAQGRAVAGKYSDQAKKR